MASAQTEPSMDEILASIRRIISEEDETQAEVPVRKKLETLQLREAPEDEGDGEAENGGEVEAQAEGGEPAAQSREAMQGEMPELPAEEADPAQAGPEALDDFGPPSEPAPEGQASMEPAAEAHDQGRNIDDTFDAPQEGPRQEASPHEAPRQESPRQEASRQEAPGQEAASGEPAASMSAAMSEALRPGVEQAAKSAFGVSDHSASQAAAAFGTLEENIRLSSGSGRTIEDLIEAMLTPLLTAWLDENLPRIVEEKVEEEVRRIARRR